MDVTGGIFRIFSFLNWIMRLAYVQLLWIVFTVLGLGIFGLFPATNAMFAMIRKWLSGKDIPVFPFMWKTYRREFMKANLHFYTLLLIGGIIYFYFKLFQNQTSIFFAILTILLFIIAIFYCFSVTIAMAVHTHYELRLRSFLTIVFYTVIRYPFHMITIGVIHVLFYFLITAIPGLVPFFSISILALAVMFVMNLVFDKMDEKQIVLNNQNS
ncbi:hypothetical protein CWR48_02570 [Oceanobacillus arenosus]|uniref:DUF624 domain-containing protein n=1 Tax=Oceanobacillus arenosus TaxID=1229153 RepID=A0A3D8PYT1_9BACI|nr:DUF624 domain-containing protein [Oceanobacillus arenosus]RDW21316.1 hypothetical protein CWR48_02570 [Oceanobacillus arenosus]